MQQRTDNPSVTSFADEYDRMLELCREKDRINEQLLMTIQKQEQQIENLLIAAEQQYQQKIRKIGQAEFKHHLIDSDYLLIRITEGADRIYLSKWVGICNNKEVERVFKTEPLSHVSSPSKPVFEELEILKSQVKEFIQPPPSTGEENNNQDKRIQYLQSKLLKYEEEENQHEVMKRDLEKYRNYQTIKQSKTNGMGKSRHHSKIVRIRME